MRATIFGAGIGNLLQYCSSRVESHRWAPLSGRARCRPASADTSPTKVTRVTYKIVDPTSLTAGPGPHPAASPFDKRVSEALGISAFEAYIVELPPQAETVRQDHLDDGVEDLYFIISGDGWVIVDDELLPVRPGLFVAVSDESTRQLRTGVVGLSFLALCGAPR